MAVASIAPWLKSELDPGSTHVLPGLSSHTSEVVLQPTFSLFVYFIVNTFCMRVQFIATYYTIYYTIRLSSFIECWYLGFF